MFSRILIATDGSDTAEVALAQGMELARRLDAEAIVVTAHRALRPGAGSALGPAEDFAADDIARSVLEAASDRYEGSVRMRTVLRQGYPADVIIDIAEESDADVIVVGNVGMAGSKRLLLGSVPNTVSHHAPCHVLIVNTGWARRGTLEERDEAGSLPRKILIGTDGSPTADRAVRIGSDLARRVEASVVLVHVGEVPKGERVLRQAADEIGEGLKISTRAVQGNPADRLLEVAEEGGADLVILGNKGMTGARRLLVGSVTNSVSHHADRNLLIVKTT